jgi:hypothetical protein
VTAHALCLHRGIAPLLWGVLGAALWLAQGCGDDPPGAGDAPATEPSLTLLSVTGAGAGGWRRGNAAECVELGHDPQQSLIAQVRIDGDWLLRPLHNCESRTRCGYVEISVSDDAGVLLLTEAAAALSINLPLAGLSLAEGTSLTFEARLMDQNGSPYVVEDGGLCGPTDTCSVTLSLAQHCAGSSGGGNDASFPPDAATLGPDPTPDAALSDAALPGTPLIDGAVHDSAVPNVNQPEAGANPGVDAASSGSGTDASAVDAG